MKTSKFFLALMAAGASLGFTQYNASAADAVTLEPEPVEYVRVCDAYGQGYFYIPGTETCMSIGGMIYGTVYGGGDVYARTRDERDPKKWRYATRAELDFSTASDTELGTLRTFIRLRGEWADGEQVEAGGLRFGYIELGGLRVGLDESAINTFFDYYGDYINDDVVLGGGYRTNMISYTYAADNGFSALISLEQGNTEDNDYNGQITDYTPHVVLAAKYEQGWGSLTGAAAYDSVNEAWIGKAKVSVNITDKFNIWGMAAYKDLKDTYYGDLDDANSIITDNSIRGIRAVDSFYGTWGGKWVGWVGASYGFTEKAKGNLQLAYEGAGNFYGAANVNYELVSGLTLIPEVNYRKWNDSKSELKGTNAFGGALRLQRDF